jgi:hypothetical protein
VRHHVTSRALLGPLGHQVPGGLTAFLALLVFSGLLTGDPHIGLAPISTAIRGSCVRWRRLVRWIGLIRQPRDATERRDRREIGEQPRSENKATGSLSAIELAVLAELNFELARAHDELADDASQRAQTRRAAHATAEAIRERGAAFHLDAQRLSRRPMLSVPSMPKPASPRTEPERRTHERRTRSRRGDGGSAAGAPGGRERRTLPDRRKRDRRGDGVVLE